MDTGYAANSLTVHDVSVQDTTDFTPQGNLRRLRTVTFYVGIHGPFYLPYELESYSADKVNTDIAAQVRELRTIVSFDHGA